MTSRVSAVQRTFAIIGIACSAILAGTRGAAAQQSGPQPASGNMQPITPTIAPVNVDTAGLKGPRQPIFFRHDIHAGQYAIDCRYCHFSAEVSMQPGIPTVSTCMGCHQIVGIANPEVAKVRQAAADAKPIEWTRIHTLPPFVHFPHMRHVVNAQLTCQTCHGPVESMPQVYDYAPLKMGWCIDCHLQRKITTDCTACHF
jgi:Cytochrome c7 and related cytochrome c